MLRQTITTAEPISASTLAAIVTVDPATRGIDATDTYFRTSDIAPRLAGDKQTIEITHGRGKRNRDNWTIITEIEIAADDMIVVCVTGWHKHTVSPVGGQYYFVRTGDTWRKVTANHNAARAYLAEQAAARLAAIEARIAADGAAARQRQPDGDTPAGE